MTIKIYLQGLEERDYKEGMEMRFTKKLMSILVCAIIITSLALSGCNNTPSTTGQSSSSSAETEEKVLIYGLGSTWNRLMPYDLNGMYMVIPNEKIFDKFDNRIFNNF